MTVAALVLGAGSGQRFRESLEAGGDERGEAGLPKIFAPLAGRSLLARSLDALAASPEVEFVVPVLSADGFGHWPAVRAELRDHSAVADPVPGGIERQDSVRRGLDALGPGVTHVAVHDAARPLVRPDDVSRVVRAACRHGAALLAVPVADTIQRVVAGRLVETPPRAECWAAQTPQVFRRDWLHEALDKAAADGYLGTDDAELVSRLGVAVHVIEGDPRNLKITRMGDLRIAEAWLGESLGSEEGDL